MASDRKGNSGRKRSIPPEHMPAIESAARIGAVMHWRYDDEPAPECRGSIPAKVAEDLRVALGFEMCPAEGGGFTMRPVEGFDPSELSGPPGSLPVAFLCRMALGPAAPALTRLGGDMVMQVSSRAWSFATDEMSRPIPGTRRDYIAGPEAAKVIESAGRKQAGA